VKLFPYIDDHRLIYAMGFLGLNTLEYTESELLLLQRTLPPQFAPFNLVSEQNLLRLHRLLLLDFTQVESKTPSNFNSQFSFATNQRAEFYFPCQTFRWILGTCFVKNSACVTFTSLFLLILHFFFSLIDYTDWHWNSSNLMVLVRFLHLSCRRNGSG